MHHNIANVDVITHSRKQYCQCVLDFVICSQCLYQYGHVHIIVKFPTKHDVCGVTSIQLCCLCMFIELVLSCLNQAQKLICTESPRKPASQVDYECRRICGFCIFQINLQMQELTCYYTLSQLIKQKNLIKIKPALRGTTTVSVAKVSLSSIALN